MKAMTKQQLADRAGVTTKTLMSWCEPFLGELASMGMQPHMKVQPPVPRDRPHPLPCRPLRLHGLPLLHHPRMGERASVAIALF